MFKLYLLINNNLFKLISIKQGSIFMESSDKNVADSSDKLVNFKNKWQLVKLLGRTKKRKNTNYSEDYEDFSTNSSLSSEEPSDRLSAQSGFIKRPRLLGQTFIKPRYKSDGISDLSDGSNGKHAKIPESINTQCWNIGWTDGRLGQDPQTGLSAADSQATIDWYNSLDSAYFDIAKDEATMQGYLVLKERATEKLKKINDYPDLGILDCNFYLGGANFQNLATPRSILLKDFYCLLT